MARQKGRRSGLQKLGADVLGLVASAREASKTALQELRREISVTRRFLEKLMAEERSFRSELFGGGGPGRPRGGGKKPGRPAGRAAAARQPRRKGPPKADAYFKKLPKAFTIEHVRKLAGKAAGISLAQWSRAKRIKKTKSGYEKVVQ
jgi:hypothetical protein